MVSGFAGTKSFAMGLEICCVIFVLSTLTSSYNFKVIPKYEYQNEEWVSEPDDVEEDENNEEIRYTTDESSGAKMKKNKKIGPKLSMVDIRYPDRPNLVLLTFPSKFKSDEKEKLLRMVDTKFSHLVDSSILKRVAAGDWQAMPNIWKFLSDYDVKGAFTTLLVQQFFKNFASADEHPTESGKSREECRTLCKNKETELIQLINGALIRLTQTVTTEGEDVRIRLRPSHKKYFKYEAAKNNKPSTCSCTSTSKTIYVSPQLKEIMNKKFFNSNEGEKEVEELIEHIFTAEKPSENSSSTWSFAKLGHVFLNSVGYGSEKRRRHEPKKYDRHWLASKTEWIVLNAVINILILVLCFPLWPFHVMFFLIGWFFV